jgi:hypothetical protein
MKDKLDALTGLGGVAALLLSVNNYCCLRAPCLIKTVFANVVWLFATASSPAARTA